MLIAISGIIGAGKSTLTHALEGIKFYEPVDSNPYLNLYYKNPERWCFPMQMHLLYERWKMCQAAFWASRQGKDAILDRSIYEDWAFASLGYQSGYMSELEYQTYCKTHELLTSEYIAFPDLVIHLACDIETAQTRIAERSRGCESGISDEYLHKLQHEYEQLLPALSHKTRVVYIPATYTKGEIHALAKKHIENRRQELAEQKAPRYRGGC